jgi:hypothetical protein
LLIESDLEVMTLRGAGKISLSSHKSSIKVISAKTLNVNEIFQVASIMLAKPDL